MIPRRSRALLLAALAALLAGACGPGATSPQPSGPPTGSIAPTAPPPSASPVASPPASPAASPPASPSRAPVGWSALATGDGPAAREDHTWTVDPETDSAWLFGGRDGNRTFDDLWRFDLVTDTWEQVDAAGAAPRGRFGHTATWVRNTGLVVWSGQADATTFFDDLWVFDPAAGAWRQLPAGDARPAERYGSCAALGPDGRLWVSHGFTADAGRFADTWAYHFAAGTWEPMIPTSDLPVARCLHDCLWTPDGQLVLYAGQTTGIAAIGDLWTRRTTGGWMRRPDEPAPPARQLYALAADGEVAWVFGGGGEDRGKLDDLWTLDLRTLAWTRVEPVGDRPDGRSGATLVADRERGRAILFGGLTDGGAVADLWALETGAGAG